MSKVSLTEFAAKVRAKGRLTFGDIQRLKRDILPDGIGSRRDAEVLVSLDRDISRTDRAWPHWLVTAMVEFVVWIERPSGVVAEDTASWLAAVLCSPHGGLPTKTARSILNDVAQAEDLTDKAVGEFTASAPKARFNQVAPDLSEAIAA